MKTVNHKGLDISIIQVNGELTIKPYSKVLKEHYNNLDFKDVMLRYKDTFKKPRVVKIGSKNIDVNINKWLEYVYNIHTAFIDNKNRIQSNVEFWEKDFDKFKEFQAGEEITGISYGNIKHIVAYSKDGLFEVNRRIDLNNGEVEDTIEFNGDLNNLVNLLKSAYDDKCNKPN